MERLRDGHQIDIAGIASALEQDREAVESIMLCSSAQGRIADDILRYSKLSMGLLSISKSDFHLVNRISEVITMFSLESAQKQIQLSLSLGPGISQHDITWINADPHRLSQVLINFLTNALRFTVASAMKTIVVKVEITPTIPGKTPTATHVGDLDMTMIPEDALWLTCSVVDTGRGLSAEDRTKLFERFSQANPKADGVGGYGLGLFVSRKIVELHHGFITVESQEGLGSTFSFSVPVTKVNEPPSMVTPSKDGLCTERRSMSPDPPQPKSLPVMLAAGGLLEPSPFQSTDSNNGHILIVEDNPINTKVLVRQMYNSGFTTTTADNGQVALDVLLAREHDTTKPRIDVVCVGPLFFLPYLINLQPDGY